MRALLYVEIDIEFCSLVYGVAPCMASLTDSPPTGTDKCFNTRKTCQDLDNYDGQSVTLRFAQAASYLPNDIEAIPSILEVDAQPAIISLDGDLGQRATFTIKLRDHPHSDAGEGFDKYVEERAYDPFRQGSFWGKFRARQPYLRGRPLRVIRGLLGQALEDMETRHYIVESFDGPRPDGTYELVAKDVLKLADGDRAQAPVLSNGFLVADISSGATAATMSPAGIGNVEYPSSGYVTIGGNEICAFTRSGDALTLTRGQLGTEAESHSAQDRVQLVLRYVGQDAAVIIADLLETYAGVQASLIPLPAWQAETAANLQRVYTATLAEPTSVKDLISELIEQAALAVWWDDIIQVIRLQVLRGVPTNVGRFTEDNVLRGSLETREQPDKRESQCWIYFGMINPLRPVDDPNNYRSVSRVIDEEAEAAYGSAVIKKIYSRWIAAFGRSVADKVGAIRLSRFRDAPRRINFDLFKSENEVALLGGGYRLEAWPIQDALGAPDDVPIQITRLTSEADRVRVEAEEVLFTAQGDSIQDGVRKIIIDTDTLNVNLREIFDSLYSPIALDEVPTPSVVCVVAAGVIVGSVHRTLPAFDVGAWEAGLSVTLEVKGRIQGIGGRGGSPDGGGSYVYPQNGGVALYTRKAIQLKVFSGKIFGGGGGGGAAVGNNALGDFSTGPAGGGGAGKNIGISGAPHGEGIPYPEDGTTEHGGAGTSVPVAPVSGDGGGPGLPGQPGTGGFENSPGGAAGAAIDGASFVTVSEGPGDIRGPQIN